MRRFQFFGSSVAVAILLISALAFINKKNDIPANHLQVVLRNVGHQLLLAGKDSSSRVLPVKKLNENTYQIAFQNNVGFISDTLINLVEREFQKNALATGYIVSLKNCDEQETVFAFEINGQTGNLTPCRGRNVAVGCYVIEIDFLKTNRFNLAWLLLLIVPFSIIVYYLINKFRKKEEKDTFPEIDDCLQLGSVKFYPGINILKINNKNTSLTGNETTALNIFAENINQVVEREKLMKEIWEDKGLVVISRNVDVLVSKLRKKLSADSALKFINVHGKGYKLVIE